MTQELTTALASLSITGAIVSLVAQYTKGWIEKRSNKMLWVVLLSVAGGGALWLLQLVPTQAWVPVLGVFAFANTCYLVIGAWTKPKTTSTEAEG